MGKKQREKKKRKLQALLEKQKELESKTSVFDIKKIFYKPAIYIYIICLLAIASYPFVYQKFIPHGKYAILQTSVGEIKIELRPDKAPKTVANFLELSRSDFYKNMIWHRVVKGFVIQTGDPTGTGTGGAGRQVDDEISDLNFSAGVVGMANAGANTNDSQFFITAADAGESLNGKYTSFGVVVSGMDVVQKINSVEVDDKEKPKEPVHLNDVVIK